MPLIVKIILTALMVLLFTGSIYIYIGWRFVRYMFMGALGFTAGIILTYIWTL